MVVTDLTPRSHGFEALSFVKSVGTDCRFSWLFVRLRRGKRENAWFGTEFHPGGGSDIGRKSKTRDDVRDCLFETTGYRSQREDP